MINHIHACWVGQSTRAGRTRQCVVNMCWKQIPISSVVSVLETEMNSMDTFRLDLSFKYDSHFKLKGHSTNFKHEDERTCHEECYSSCENCCIMSSVALSKENNPVDVARVVPEWAHNFKFLTESPGHKLGLCFKGSYQVTKLFTCIVENVGSSIFSRAWHLLGSKSQDILASATLNLIILLLICLLFPQLNESVLLNC